MEKIVNNKQGFRMSGCPIGHFENHRMFLRLGEGGESTPRDQGKFINFNKWGCVTYMYPFSISPRITAFPLPTTSLNEKLSNELTKKPKQLVPDNTINFWVKYVEKNPIKDIPFFNIASDL